MKNILLISITLALLVVSFAFTASADSQSQIQACISFGYPADICANCIAAIDNGKGDIGPCMCKLMEFYDPSDFDATYANFGECVSSVQQNLH